MRRVERSEAGNDYLTEAVNGDFSNGKRGKGKVDTECATFNNLLEKMNSMERKTEKRMTSMMKEHKAELKRARAKGNGGGSKGGYQGSKGGGGYQGDANQDTVERERKISKRQFV